MSRTEGPVDTADSNATIADRSRPDRSGPFDGWRFVPIDTYPRVITFAQKPLGRVILLTVFAVLLRQAGGWWLPVTVGAAACAFAGRYRPQVLTLVTLIALVKTSLSPGWFRWPAIAYRPEVQGLTGNHLRLVMLLAVLLISWGSIRGVRRFPHLIPARRPVLTLLVVVVGLLLLAASDLLHGTSQVLRWSFLATFAAHLWFLGYALADQRGKDISPPVVRLGAFHAFWGGSSTPIGKGLAYLGKIEAKTPLELAVTQLKGVKLLAWVLVLRLLSHSLRFFAVSLLRIPPFETALTEQIAGHPYPWYVCWASIVYTFLHNTLALAIWGNVIVAGGRMAGYRLLRNSYRPLSARTLADFWNRYYYYYKELLVDFFFFPTFLRCFKRHRRLRLFFATVMAAGVGNFLYHVIRDNAYVAELGLWPTIIGYQTFAFYCVILSFGIALSQLRSRRRRVHRGWVRGQLVPSLGVILFYCLLEVFMVTYSPHSLKDRFLFLFRLFGVDV